MKNHLLRTAIASALLALPDVVAAQATIQSAVDPVDIWSDGNYFSWFLSSDALLAAKNAHSLSQFNSCLAYFAAASSQSYQCGRVEMTGIRPYTSVFPQLINGLYVFYMVNATFFFVGQNDGTPFADSQDASDHYGAYRSVVCPLFHPHYPMSVPNGDNSTLLTCVNYKAPPTQCKRGDPGKSAGTGAPGGVGNPIQIYGGIKTESQTDYADPRGLLFVQRKFIGQADGWRMPGDPWLVDTFSAAISQQNISEVGTGTTLDDNGSIATSVTLTFPFVRTDVSGEVYLGNPDGSLARYAPAGAGAFGQDPSGETVTRLATPTADGATWRVNRSNNVIDEFGTDGRLRRKQMPTGAFVRYQYSSGALVSMVDNWGRQVTFVTDASGKPTSATLPNGSNITYVWTDGRLTSVTYPDGAVRQFLYNEAAYAPGAYVAPHSLTGTVENGVRVGTYYYDPSGNAISTELAGGVSKFVVQSGGGSYAQITDPLGASRTSYFTTTANGKVVVSQQYQPGGSGCDPSSNAITYDDNGNIASRDDFNGTRACYGYDLSRNLETARVEGLNTSAACSTVTVANVVLPTGSRKVSSQWHPDWRLATKVSESGRITTSVYNGQPDPFNGNALASCAPVTALLPDGKPIAVVCKQVEQATTDANGSLGFSAALQAGVANRQTTWTYNQWGQVLTENGPRTDVNDTTTYSYYSDTSFTGVGAAAQGHYPGDLASVTNAAGRVTTYSKYNKHGQLLESTDPNGVLTVNTYDLRQRLLSTTVGGQATSYQYDPAGQLKRVTLPDTSWVGYDYDDAHRQVAVYDNKGNRTEYVLDNAGNRTGENTKDPGGNLKRQLSRSIDALGRVQQTTGRE